MQSINASIKKVSDSSKLDTFSHTVIEGINEIEKQAHRSGVQASVSISKPAPKPSAPKVAQQTPASISGGSDDDWSEF